MLSIIIPAMNEEESLPQLYQEIDTVTRENDIAIEIVFIDDGSSDGTWSVIEDLASKDDRVNGIRFRRNFGKAAALTAAMRAASGELIMMMDADLQDDPSEIPEFLKKMEEGNDVVNGWKQRRLDPWHKVYPSRVFNWMVSSMTGLKLHDHNCGFKLFRAEVASEIRIYGELHRFIAVLAHARGFKVTEIPVHHRSREHGVSKYGVKRFMRGFLDLLTVKFLTGWGQRPQHMLGTIGFGAFGVGGLGLTYLTILWLLTRFGVHNFGPIGDRPMLIYSVAAILLGAQAISLGLIAELMVSFGGREKETYSVRERVAGGSVESAKTEVS